MIIDCHTHVYWQNHNPDQAVRHMDHLGVDRAWVLSWEDMAGGIAPGLYQHLSVDRVMSSYRQHPDRFIPFCGLDPRRDNAEEMLRRLVDQGCRGYGEIKFRLLLDNPDLMAMYALCEELKLPVLVHIEVPLSHDKAWYGGTVDALERVLKTFPKVNFVGHGPGFWREISGDAAEDARAYPNGPITPGGKLKKFLGRYPNLYADLSASSGLTAMRRDPRHAKRFLTRYHTQVLYGTDIYWSDHLDFLRGLNLDKSTLANILGRNAAKLTRK
jgi:uncharacterized protein